jgi:hypothetical protein
MGRSGMYIGYWWESQMERRPKCRLVNNIKMNLREIRWCDMD